MLFVVTVIICVGSVFVWRAATAKLKQGNAPFRTIASGSILVGIVFGILAVLQCLTQIPAGHVGVVDFFGVVSDQTMRAGINPVNPLATVVKYSIQTQGDDAGSLTRGAHDWSGSQRVVPPQSGLGRPRLQDGCGWGLRNDHSHSSIPLDLQSRHSEFSGQRLVFHRT
jgi:hypothetical protein